MPKHGKAKQDGVINPKYYYFHEFYTHKKGVDDDFNEMFRRLEVKYGRPETSSDGVLCELRQITFINDGDNRGFMCMVETVENCWLDFRKARLESAMNTSSMVSQIDIEIDW